MSICSMCLEALSFSKMPCQAIIKALSVRTPFEGMKHSAFLSLHMIFVISWSLVLQATPPPSKSSFFWQWAIARSATSVSIAKTVSCKEYESSSFEWLLLSTLFLRLVKMIDLKK